MDGNVKITVDPRHSEKFAIYVRIPDWAQGHPVPGDLYRYTDNSNEKVHLSINDKEVALNMEKGFVKIERNWKKGDVIELNLPMQVRRVIANDQVTVNLGKVALERGPIVYCVEGVDNNGHVFNLFLGDSIELTAEYRND